MTGNSKFTDTTTTKTCGTYLAFWPLTLDVTKTQDISNWCRYKFLINPRDLDEYAVKKRSTSSSSFEAAMLTIFGLDWTLVRCVTISQRDTPLVPV